MNQKLREIHTIAKRSPDLYQALNILDDDFHPSPYSVICGRGKRFFDAIGNRRLKVTASLFFKQYSKADKVGKIEIVSKIIAITRAACSKGAFIKFIAGRWVEVKDRAVREKVGSVLRDCLHEQYRSSSKSKVARRKSIKLCSSDKPRKAKCVKVHHLNKARSKKESSEPIVPWSGSFQSWRLPQSSSSDNFPRTRGSAKLGAIANTSNALSSSFDCLSTSPSLVSLEDNSLESKYDNTGIEELVDCVF